VRLFGNKDCVHFMRVDEGSAIPVLVVDDIAVPKVEKRMLGVRTGNGISEASKAFQNIDDRLLEDNTAGRIFSASGATLIEFPGKSRSQDKPVRSIREAGTLDGEVISIGGRDETISVQLRSDEQIYFCTASREQGRRMAKHLFENPIRVYGDGVWTRLTNGTWKLERFIVDSFIPLRAETLSEVVRDLRYITSAELDAVEDPLAFLADLNEAKSCKGKE